MKPAVMIEDIAKIISECSSNIPFYIHTLVARIHDESDVQSIISDRSRWEANYRSE